MRNTISLDLTRNDVAHVISDDPNNKVRYIQDGIEFTADGKPIGDPVELLRKKREEAVRKAERELEQRKAELEAEARELGLDLDAGSKKSGGSKSNLPPAAKPPGPVSKGDKPDAA